LDAAIHRRGRAARLLAFAQRARERGLAACATGLTQVASEAFAEAMEIESRHNSLAGESRAADAPSQSPQPDGDIPPDGVLDSGHERDFPERNHFV
jgi:hypothetical protein